MSSVGRVDARDVSEGRPLDAVLARFRVWLKEQDFQLNDADWASSRDDIRDQLTYEMQTVSHGVEAGFRTLTQKDSQSKKALDLLPEAEQLLKRRLAKEKLDSSDDKGKVALK